MVASNPLFNPFNSQEVPFPGAPSEKPVQQRPVQQQAETDAADMEQVAEEAVEAVREEEEETAQQPNQQQLLWQQQALREMALMQQIYQKETERQQLEDYVWQTYRNNLTPAQKMAADQLYAYAKQQQNLELQNKQLEASVRMMEEATLPMIKDRAFSLLSQQFGIEKDIISRHAKSADEAMAIAKALADYRKKANFQKRVAQGNDKVGSTSGQANVIQMDPAMRQKYQNTGRITDYIREMKKSGRW